MKIGNQLLVVQALNGLVVESLHLFHVLGGNCNSCGVLVFGTVGLMNDRSKRGKDRPSVRAVLEIISHKNSNFKFIVK